MSALQVATPQPATAGARTSVGAAQSTFQNRLSQIARRAAAGADEEIQVLEDARIVPDERSNKLLVFANKRDMEMITNIVSKVDVLLAQVLIEAVIMEVRLGDSQKLGVSWAQRPKRFGEDFSGAGTINNGQGFLNNITNFPGTVGNPGLTYFGAINDQWDVVINAVAEDSSINVVSRPRIQTSHAIPGSFFVGETVPYITGFTDYGGYNTGVATRSVVQQANVGFSLFVTPFITPDGLVVMEIAQEFSTRGRDVLIDENPIPIINGRNAESTLTVRDSDTIMMGGFITETQSRAKSGVPFLKDIPGVGVLFRSKDNSNDRTELIVLMRARVLRTPEDAAIMAAEERSELPGVMQAEQDLRRANEKRKERSLKQKR
ncbi:MAG: type II secretion system protein GspD [Verrucomicrobiia bacterium]